MGRDEGWWWAVYIDMIDITPTKQAVYIYIYINLLQVPSLLLFNFGFCIELYNWTFELYGDYYSVICSIRVVSQNEVFKLRQRCRRTHLINPSCVYAYYIQVLITARDAAAEYVKRARRSIQASLAIHRPSSYMYNNNIWWCGFLYYYKEEAKNRQLEQDSLSSSIGLDWCWYGTKTDPESRTTSHSSVYYLIFSLPSSYIKVDWLITRYCASLFLADRSKIYIQSFFSIYRSL